LEAWFVYTKEGTVELAVMAKKKTAPKPQSRADRPAIAVTLRGGPDWKGWVEGLANHCRMDVAKVIDRALIDYARKEGFKPEAPQR
jgi:hypothetical protein